MRIYVDFRNLNNACPKDDFPLPITELMIDATTGHEVLLFMDGSSGYNQIRLALEDEELAAFRTPKGIYYKVMPFGLKNAGATYQKCWFRLSRSRVRNLAYAATLVGRLTHHNQKLKHYFQAHSVRLISRANPIKYVMSRPILSDRLARWYLQLQQFEIIYVPQKVVKGQVLADFLADHPIPAEWELSDDLPDEGVLLIEIRPPWKIYFDGVAHRQGAGAGIVFVTPDGRILLYFFTLNQRCSNNVAEYQALILGLEIAVDMEQLDIQIYGDSQLVINQLLGSYEVKKSKLIPYHKYATRLMKWLRGASIKHVPRRENKQVDALAVLASSLAMPDHEIQVRVCQKRYQKLPDEQRRRTDIRRRAPRFILYKDTLYRRSFEGVLLRCLSEDEAYRTMYEAHSGICGDHQSGPKLHFQIKRMGYYWPTMVKDCIEYAQRCQTCQFHANYIHQPPEPLHPTVASWHFDAWGLDVVGPLPKSFGQHLYILAATDYFSKWAEVIPLKQVRKEDMINFVRVNIIYRYGIPRYIITDNGKSFSNSLMDKLCEKFNLKQRKSSMYNAPANGLAWHSTKLYVTC
ncbi:uncharacterized protein LOC113759746 [Coffea eugenioides]|uniref:uncharacterized protein LOC113759746 n=1 Tax=Coffea eugenioides TaxID=49369 RepID=UPI000F61188C|nr:uncharacterized protein LOC113759746 [Coffea eugenioides]